MKLLRLHEKNLRAVRDLLKKKKNRTEFVEEVIKLNLSIDVICEQKEKLETETGELKQSYFDGEVSISLRGIKLGEKGVITRIHEWRLENRGTRAA